MVFWYTNSLLASLVSIFGCVMVITAIQEGIWGLAIAGLALVALGKFISYRKEQKQKKNRQPENCIPLCPKCRVRIPEDSSFCPKCGAPVLREQSAGAGFLYCNGEPIISQTEVLFNMFCRNCGKEIPDNTNFCNYCGAAQNNGFAQNMQSNQQSNGAQHSAINSQPVYTTPHSSKIKKKSPMRIVIGIAVVAVAFVIGYFATGADKLEPPTPFDPPAVHDPVDLPSPSIKQDTTDDSILTNGKECKTFVMESDVARSYTKFFYGDDGIVNSINGAITVNDTTMVDTGYLADLIADAETATGLLLEMGVSDTSYVLVTNDTDDSKFTETYSFALLDEDMSVAELAAKFIGFEAENGKIMIDKAETAMLGFGFSLQ